MAVGKSTVGAELARSMGYNFIDTDELISAAAKKTIPEIFAKEGEASFRQREHQVLKDLQGEQGSVISTGGGIVVEKHNHLLLKKLGYLVWLKCPITEILERVRANTDRPLAQGQTLAEAETKLRELMRQRKPIYQMLSDIEVKANELHLDDIVYGISESARLYFDQA